MKVNELMIGDWVYNNVADITFQVYPQFFSQWRNRPEQFEVTIQPIPLTPEILEKNGFKINKNETYWKRYFFACNLGKVPQTVVEFSFYGEGFSANTLFKCWTKPESCDGENSIHVCDLKSVHELQHALRLCGIEKEIKL